MKQLQSIDIERPIDEVFEYTTTMVAEWSIIVVEESLLKSVNNGGVGTTFRIVTEERGQRMEFESEVTSHEPPYRSGIVMTEVHFDIHANYVFEEINGGTRVTQDSEVFPKRLLMKIMFTLMGPFMKKSGCDALQTELQSLKNHLEHPEKFPEAPQ